ncbi:hypothetical protein BDR04DRAFT_515686 [Suillus decipiens]|nr:hypothetical protein BDR04DRAFT_515686 [Suillus decipiens]
MVQIAPLFHFLATVAQAPPVARNVSPNTLAVRQVNTSDLPSQCQTTCQVINTMTDCGTSLSCICVSSIGTQLQSCLDCLVAAEPSALSDADTAINNWDQACGGDFTVTLSSSTSTTSESSTATSTGSSSSNPFVTKTGDAVGMKTAIGALGLTVAIACSVIVL